MSLQAVTLALTALAYLGALLQRLHMLSASLMGMFTIFVLGSASVLSPVIVLRVIVLVLGFQVCIKLGLRDHTRIWSRCSNADRAFAASVRYAEDDI